MHHSASIKDLTFVRVVSFSEVPVNLWEGEPTAAMWDLYKDGGKGMIEIYRLDLQQDRIDLGLSTFAIDGDTMVVVGQRMTEPYLMFAKYMYPAQLERVIAKHPHLAPLAKLLQRAVPLHRAFVKKNNITDPKKIAHFCGLAVAPNWRRRGLARELTKQTLAHLKTEGYQCVFVETTSDGSRKIMKNLGATELYLVPYDNYCKENECVVIEGHLGYGFYAFLL